MWMSRRARMPCQSGDLKSVQRFTGVAVGNLGQVAKRSSSALIFQAPSRVPCRPGALQEFKKVILRQAGGVRKFGNAKPAAN